MWIVKEMKKEEMLRAPDDIFAPGTIWSRLLCICNEKEDAMDIVEAMEKEHKDFRYFERKI